MPLRAIADRRASSPSRDQRLEEPLEERDEGWFDSALAACARIVHIVSARYRLTADEADELAQEVRVRLWRVLRAPARSCSVNDAYMHQTATTAALDILRRRRRAVERWLPIETVSASDVEDGSAAARPERGIELGELTAQIDIALSQLSTARQHAVRLYLIGYSCGEIARKTGWSEARARNLLYRGLAQLRVRLDVDPD